MKQFLLTTGLGLVFSAGAGCAAPATDEGVARLTEVFQRYLGTTEGALAVKAEGETYSVTLDPVVYATLLPEEARAEVEVAASPLVMVLGDQGDGTWTVTMDQPFSMKFDGKRQVVIDYAASRMTMNGIFDEALMAFRQNEFTVEGVVVNETLPMEPGGKTYTVSYTIEEQSAKTAATAGAAGGVDGTGSFTQSGMRQVMSYPPMAEGMGPFEVEATVATAEGTFSSTGVRPDAFLSLIAFFVAHPSEDAIKGAQEDLRNTLSAGLPFFGAISVDGTYKDISVTTPMGAFTAASAGIEVDANGAVPDGQVREAVTLDGLEVPEGILPPWVAPLVPVSVSFDIAADRFNARDPIRMLIEAFDLTKEQPIPEALGPSLMQALLPEGTADLTFAPGAITGKDYSLSFEGGMKVGPGVMPTGKALVRAEGLDKIEAALAAAPPEVSAQAAGALMFLKGMGKPAGEGAYSWDVDASEPGKLLINGNDMSMMMGAGQ